MKIHLANFDPQRQGGGWTFQHNFAKGVPTEPNYDEADIYFITSASMVGHEDVERAKKDGKKIVLRIDNIVRNSRNRNTGMSRMKAFGEMADLIIYQSEYALEVLGKQFLRRTGPVILNGCDTATFKPDGREESLVARYLYSRVNRDETKNWEMARFVYQQEALKRSNQTLLNIVGEYSPELLEYGFDFYMDEPYHYWGVIRDPAAMAAIYRNSDYLIYTFWNDACSNTLIEALCSGCNVVDPYRMLQTGGAPDIWRHFEDRGGSDYFTIDRMTKDYLSEMARL